MSFFENATVDQTGTLLVTAVTPEYQGHYTCYAWNSLGYSTAIAFITVEGKHKLLYPLPLQYGFLVRI